MDEVGQNMAVRLEFLTPDHGAVFFAERYWAMNPEGSFVERVADLLPFRDIIKASAVGKYVREICQAFDENQTCPVCDGLIRINARSEAKKTPRRAYGPCEDCQRHIREELDAKEAEERAELERHLAPYIVYLRAKTVSYSDFEDDSVIILQAINALIGPRLVQGTFSQSDCDQLTPVGTGDFIESLYTREVLEDDPTTAPYGTYSVKDENLLIRHSTARYFLPPDSEMGRDPRAFQKILDWKFSDSEALINLWLDYAVTDVMRYMDYQCSRHNQYLDLEKIQKIEGMVRQGLRTYSVAQMWFIMWKVTRDAAALSSRTYYNQEKATATIPTKFRKQLEAAVHGAVLPNHWSRPVHQIAGALGMVFNEHFGLDEYSKGDEVLQMFTRIGSQDTEEVNPHTLAAVLMDEALKSQSSFAAFDAFAQLIRNGLSTEDAIALTIKHNTELFRAPHSVRFNVRECSLEYVQKRQSNLDGCFHFT